MVLVSFVEGTSMFGILVDIQLCRDNVSDQRCVELTEPLNFDSAATDFSHCIFLANGLPTRAPRSLSHRRRGAQL